MTQKIEISHRTIVFTLVLFAGIWLTIQIRDILFLLFISFLLMTAIRPFVERLALFRIPRVVVILAIYIVVFGLLGMAIASAIPSLIIQSAKFTAILPSLVARLMPYWDVNIQAFTQQIAPIGENLLRVTMGLFSNIVTTLTILVFTFYLLLERRHTEKMLVGWMGKEKASQFISLIQIVELRLGAWIRGQLLLMVTIGIMSYIGLSLLHVEFALPLAIIAGLMEIIPMVGALISAIPAVLIALTISPFLSLSVAALYVVIHQLENNLVVPFIMKKSVGLPPLATILALMVGGRLAGVTGAMLAIPLVIVTQVVVSELFIKNSPKSPPNA